jgi:hypothetical protein
MTICEFFEYAVVNFSCYGLFRHRLPVLIREYF